MYVGTSSGHVIVPEPAPEVSPRFSPSRRKIEQIGGIPGTEYIACLAGTFALLDQLMFEIRT